MAQQLLKAKPSDSSKFWKTLFSIFAIPFSVPIHNSPLESTNNDRMALLGIPSRVVKCLDGYCWARLPLPRTKTSRREANKILVRKIFLYIFHLPGRHGKSFTVSEDHVIIFFINLRDLLYVYEQAIMDTDKLLHRQPFLNDL